MIDCPDERFRSQNPSPHLSIISCPRTPATASGRGWCSHSITCGRKLSVHRSPTVELDRSYGLWIPIVFKCLIPRRHRTLLSSSSHQSLSRIDGGLVITPQPRDPFDARPATHHPTGRIVRSTWFFFSPHPCPLIRSGPHPSMVRIEHVLPRVRRMLASTTPARASS